MSGSVGGAAKQVAGIPSSADPTSAKVQTKTTIAGAQAEFDEYGTEMHRDARVWKVYVQETDKHDAELVKGWNDSTDVILIFATLFSAIATAFLIESSKMLREDPADTSAQAPLVISQTLLILSNGTQQVGTTASAYDNDKFVPSRAAVYVNTLWYLSLSLSLATSFIAILSKDWCHSFMSGRTGHAYPQTCRRQQKWDMLKRWKMSELLAVLPSLIHAALLLFSIGLCILLWDMHSIVAVPVICVSGAAFGFYICSSVAAVMLDFFPYPTIVSRLCRTKPVRVVAQFTSQAMFQVVIPLIISSLHHTTWLLIYVAVCPFKLLLHGLTKTFDWLADPHMGYRWINAFKIWKWLCKRTLYKATIADLIGPWVSRPQWKLRWTNIKINNDTRANEYGFGRGELTSLALSWLIENCEVPQSVDIALQSIAGASKDFYREPLQRCNAAVEISRRLASSNLYKGTNTEVVVSLYSRALSFLGSSIGQNVNPTEPDSRGSLEVMIWDMQTHIENSVAGLITDGNSQPNAQNLAALRIGNTAASYSLQLLKDNTGGASELFSTIIQLLEQHVSKEIQLHPSALLSVVRAATLVSLLANNPTACSPLPRLCVMAANDIEYAYIPQVTVALVMCVLLQNKHSSKRKLLHSGASVSVEGSIRALVDLQSQSKEMLSCILEFGLEELLRAPEDYQITSGLGIRSTYSHNPSWNLCRAIEELHRGTIGESAHQCLHVLYDTYNLTAVGAPRNRTYAFVVAFLHHHAPSRPQCWQLLSKFRFLKLSWSLLGNLRQFSIIDSLVLETTTGDQAMQFFANGHLWLLFALLLDRSASTEEQEQLRIDLKSCNSVFQASTDAEDHARLQHLGDLLEQSWNQSIIESIGIYAYRLMECVFQSRNCPIPQEIHDGLQSVPEELRGLPSFMDWRPQPSEGREASVSEDGISGIETMYSDSESDLSDIGSIYLPSHRTATPTGSLYGGGTTSAEESTEDIELQARVEPPHGAIGESPTESSSIDSRVVEVGNTDGELGGDSGQPTQKANHEAEIESTSPILQPDEGDAPEAPESLGEDEGDEEDHDTDGVEGTGRMADIEDHIIIDMPAGGNSFINQTL